MAHGAQACHAPPATPSLAAESCLSLGDSGAAGRVGAPRRPDGGAVCFGSSQEHAGNLEAVPAPAFPCVASPALGDCADHPFPSSHRPPSSAHRCLASHPSLTSRLPRGSPSRRLITGAGDAKGRRAAAHLCRGRSRHPAALAPGGARGDRLPRICAQNHACCTADTAEATLTSSARAHGRWGRGRAGGGGGAAAVGGQGEARRRGTRRATATGAARRGRRLLHEHAVT